MTRIPNYELAQQKAYKALSLLNTDAFPIDPEEIIQILPDLELSTYTEYAKFCNCEFEDIVAFFGSSDGTIWSESKGGKNKNIIFYNDSITYEPTIRFTLAHELGHYFLNHRLQLGQNQIEVDPEEYDVMEKEANYFAKRFLVPLPVVYKIMSNLPEQSISNSELQEVFEVSEPTSTYIISNMNKLNWIPIDDGLCSRFSPGIKQAQEFITLLRKIHSKRSIAL